MLSEEFEKEVKKILLQVKNKIISPEAGDYAINELKNHFEPSVEMNTTPESKGSGVSKSGEIDLDEIAIIGMSGRFPGADNLEKYWDNLSNGVSSIIEVPKERWDIEEFFDEDENVLDKTNSRWGGFIDNIDKFNEEILSTAKAYKEVTGKEMPKYFRPPMGKFSERSLKYTQDLGYSTIFWSFAYVDWYDSNQPSHEEAKKKIYSRTHPGAIVLLHSNSQTNAEILDEVLTHWEEEGYTIKSLDYLTDKKTS